jgi:regulator of sigma E protease
VSGPVGIAQATGEVVKEAGWKSLLDLTALLSINLAVINILPLPFLDGGRIVFVLLEIIRRGRRIAPQKEAIVHLVGLVFFMTFVVVISYFDIARIIHGDSFFR